MTPAEAAEIVSLLMEMYPNMRGTDRTQEAWVGLMLTANLEHRATTQAAMAWLKREKFPPTFAELRALSDRIADEQWKRENPYRALGYDELRAAYVQTRKDIDQRPELNEDGRLSRDLEAIKAERDYRKAGGEQQQSRRAMAPRIRRTIDIEQLLADIKDGR